MTNQQHENLTRNEAAAFLGVAPKTLANWASNGRVAIPFYKVGPRSVVYRRADLEAYLSSVKMTHTSQHAA